MGTWLSYSLFSIWSKIHYYKFLNLLGVMPDLYRQQKITAQITMQLTIWRTNTVQSVQQFPETIGLFFILIAWKRSNSHSLLVSDKQWNIKLHRLSLICLKKTLRLFFFSKTPKQNQQTSATNWNHSKNKHSTLSIFQQDSSSFS